MSIKFSPNKIVRGNYHIYMWQKKAIKELAKKNKVSESEMVRRLLTKSISNL